MFLRECEAPPHETTTTNQTDSTKTVSSGDSSTETTSSSTTPAMATGVGETANQQPEKTVAETEQEPKAVIKPEEAEDGIQKADPPVSVSTANSNSEDKEVVKPENTWHDVAVVKSTSFTVTYYVEKVEGSTEDKDVVAMPDQVRFVASSVEVTGQAMSMPAWVTVSSTLASVSCA